MSFISPDDLKKIAVPAKALTQRDIFNQAATAPQPKADEPSLLDFASGTLSGVASWPEAFANAFRPERGMAAQLADRIAPSKTDVFGKPSISAQQAQARTSLDLPGQLERAGLNEAQPQEPMRRATYDLGRNLGSSAPFAPVMGPLTTLLGAAGSTGAGEVAHAVLPNEPVAEQIASIVGGSIAPATKLGTGATIGTGQGLIRPLTQAGREAVVGQALNEARTGDTASSIEPAPLGIPQTLGQATNSPGILALEKMVAKGNPNDTAAFLGIKGEANRAILNELRARSTGQSMEHANATVRGALEDALSRSNQRESTLWNDIDPNGTVRVPSQIVDNVVSNFEASLPIVDRGTAPSWLGPAVDKFNQTSTTSLRDIMAFDSRLGREIRGAAVPQEKFYLQGLQRDLRSQLASQEFPINEPDALGRWQTARTFTAAQKQVYDNNPYVRSVLGANGKPGRVPESATIQSFVRANGGSPEAIDSLLAASPRMETYHGVRDFILDKLTGATNKAELDTHGNPVFSDVKMRDVLKNYDAPIGRVFTPAERQVMNEIARASEVLQRTTRAGYRGGSDTFSMLSGSRFIDRILQGVVHESAPVASAALGMAKGGPVGAVALGSGAYVARSAYLKAQQSIESLMRQALLNPALGKALMVKATNANLALLPKDVQPFLTTYTIDNKRRESP